MRCSAKSKRTGRQCGAAAVTGRKTCYHHGGATPRGIASPNFKTGNYCDDLPPTLAERHRVIVEDLPNLMRLHKEIAFLEETIRLAMQRLSTGERGTVWDDLQFLVADAENGQPIDLEQLKAIAAKGKTTEQAMRDIDRAIHSKAKIVSVEAKRMADMGEVASRDEVKVLVLQIVNVIKEAADDAITDDQHRQAFLTQASKGLTAVLHGPRKAQAKPRVIDVTPAPEPPAATPPQEPEP